MILFIYSTPGRRLLTPLSEQLPLKNPVVVRPVLFFFCLENEPIIKEGSFGLVAEIILQMKTASLPGMDIYITSDVNCVLILVPVRGDSYGTFEVRTGLIKKVPEVIHDAFLNKEGISKKGDSYSGGMFP